MSFLFDNHGRRINYVRLAITDRCNLRCTYCMPEEGIKLEPKSGLMTFEEILRMMHVFAGFGVNKVRITGGEPFVRRDVMDLFRGLAGIPGIDTLTLTTNGTHTAPHIAELKELGVRSVNLSLDSLDRERFRSITRRDEFDRDWATLEALLRHELEAKINVVLMQGRNDVDLLPFVALTQNCPVSVRFIEEMPFNGSGANPAGGYWDWKRIASAIQESFPGLYKVEDPPNSTALHYRIPGHLGGIGIIPAFSRTFCGTCNRLRVTPQGVLKTCLYDDGIFNIRDLMRAGASNDALKTALLEAAGNRAKDGFEAESRRFSGLPVRESMTTIGG
ncbi:MAG: GTP 3',8-cyclase MoaA [Saprospirales bacterium]|nr:GTP 3',8-cyclase MoaA [Saprospirales bacterium]